MPSNLVKTKHDEHLWELAKEAYERKVKKSGPAKEKWAYITKTFETMKHGSNKTKGGLNTMTPDIRTLLAEAVTADFINQAVTIITALDEPAPSAPPAAGTPPASKRAPVIPSGKPLDPNSQESKDFVGYTNFLAEVEKNLKHSMGMMLSYSQSFQKQLKQTLRLFDSKKSKLTMGDVRAMATLVDAVQKVMRAVDSVADRFEFLNDGVQKLADSTKPPPSKNLSEEDRKKQGLPPITDVDDELKQGETKTKLKDFFQEMKNKFGSKPQAASVLMARALMTTAKTLTA